MARRGLLASAASLPVLSAAAAQGPDHDAELLTLCAEQMDFEQRREQLQELFWAAEEAGDKAEEDRIFYRMRDEVPAMHERIARIAELPSRTRASARAKAAVLVKRTQLAIDGSPEEEEALGTASRRTCWL